MKKYIREAKNRTDGTVKVCIIKPSGSKSFTQYKKSMMGVPQNIFSLAACTPDWVDIQMVDETIGMKANMGIKADIVVLMFHTPHAVRAYDLTDRFRARGITVVLGGLHPTFMPEEASKHADALLIGECEDIWEDLLNDWLKGTLRYRYQRTEPADMAKLKPYPTDIIPPQAYGWSWTVMVSRGCVNKCSYCTVHNFFPCHRYRPIKHIVQEIKNCGTDFIELKADNMTVDREYALKLFKAIEPLNIIWFSSFEPSFANDKELVKTAVKSGLRTLLLGVETPSVSALQSANKAQLKLEELKRQIAYLHDFDIEVDSAMLFGFDEHDNSIWEKTLKFALEIDLDVTHGVAPIPFPGTAFFKKLDEQGRIDTFDWSKYDGTHLVYTHPNLTLDEVYHGLYWYEEEFKKQHKPRSFTWKKRWDY